MTRTVFERWQGSVLGIYKDAKFTKEDGSGVTYGEIGDWTATIPPHDMQANVVGVYCVETQYAYYLNEEGEECTVSKPVM